MLNISVLLPYFFKQTSSLTLKDTPTKKSKATRKHSFKTTQPIFDSRRTENTYYQNIVAAALSLQERTVLHELNVRILHPRHSSFIVSC